MNVVNCSPFNGNFIRSGSFGPACSGCSQCSGCSGCSSCSGCRSRCSSGCGCDSCTDWNSVPCQIDQIQNTVNEIYYLLAPCESNCSNCSCCSSS